MADEMDVDVPPVDEQQQQIQPQEQEQPQPQPQPQQVKKTKSSKKKFEVRKWTAVAFWSWDIKVETCAICRNHVMEPCIDCQPNSLNDDSEECIPAWGTCNHAFHFHCIAKWLKTRNACPLDNKEWQYQKYGR
ncbi:hypothetical protein WICPIJ_001120 [Wickerhamomyces pijperi]|uniref:RING-type domain-containing protein n=1 Tax=Wickerhamomyces pijperi TaxID=599730 RepID=A0A9P8TQ77_WICPI|nr:hypothetical protein WICPIJ_001120 [Wickerhamomyces pijperi]